mgnify:CR=1 FL=1
MPSAAGMTLAAQSRFLYEEGVNRRVSRTPAFDRACFRGRLARGAGDASFFPPLDAARFGLAGASGDADFPPKNSVIPRVSFWNSAVWRSSSAW